MRVCVYVSNPVKVTLPALIHGATLVLFTEETAESLMGRTVPHALSLSISLFVYDYNPPNIYTFIRKK